MLRVGLLLAGLCGAVPVTDVRAQWTQWGGSERNFATNAKGLAESWPEGGPKQLWKRELGDGYSTILVEDGVLYTMYRVGDDEFPVALRATLVIAPQRRD